MLTYSMFIDGHPFAMARCLGDHVAGAYWSGIDWQLACDKIEKSIYSDELEELTTVRPVGGYLLLLMPLLTEVHTGCSRM